MTEYVVSRNQNDQLIVLELLIDDGISRINKVFTGPFKAGTAKFFAKDIRTKSKKMAITYLFERV